MPIRNRDQDASDAVEAEAEFSDGESAARRRVRVRLGLNALDIVDAATGERVAAWPLAHIRFADRTSRPTKPLRLTVADAGGAREAIGVAHQSDQRLTLIEDEAGRAFRSALLARAGVTLRRPAKIEGALRRRLIWTFAGAAATVAFVLFVLIPVAADRLAVFITPERENDLGAAMLEALFEPGAMFGAEDGAAEADPFCEAEDGRAALARMVERLHLASALETRPMVYVTRTPPIENAFALPGGFIIVTEQLIRKARSAEEVAGVVAHEIGHQVHRDALRATLRTGASFAVLSVLLGDVSGGFIGAGVASQAVEASHTRDAESRADDVALAILRRAELPPAALAAFFDRLVAEYGDEESLFRTHPMSADRAAKFRAAPPPPANAAPVLTAAEWRALRNICGA